MMGEVEDVEHLLLRCICMVEERRQMEKLTVDEWHEMEDKQKVVVMLDEACESDELRRAVKKLYRRQFAGS